LAKSGEDFKEGKMAAVTDNKKEMIDQACRTAKEFLDHYYVKVDSKRHTVAKTYLETATLSWNGNRVDGKNLN
jgi:NTF2-related export protein 1/2